MHNSGQCCSRHRVEEDAETPTKRRGQVQNDRFGTKGDFQVSESCGG